ncbi:4-hydroxybenzoate polyprenyltransferase [Hymenobacter luteus]|uniref:4-hydroxybenzoate polyprenyltransferase n=2 Tax=Hymenobacter TaxID=89966 RepID=A0A7W9WD73_9BACT|nr:MULTISPECIES: UbiA family prenyltransferase [Hymenobacter]MBB4602194.1 4-hydroxybenzoate polyprenyltransferase [Hymenobacter latericoloratus]MBB6059377.1 4-hydroxybenzoate polyprenyltransferase [Hymenobacter luteus]
MNQTSIQLESDSTEQPLVLLPAKLKDYVAIARPDNWAKNVFMVPGMLFALIVYGTPLDAALVLNMLLGVVSTCLVASANYVINEYLDAEFDKFHPLKKKRTSVVRVVNPVLVYSEWFGLAAVGLAIGYSISVQFLCVSAFLLFMGVLYNVRPFRTKERPYIDVLSESVNNPIRFALGWFTIAPALSIATMDSAQLFNSFPPTSIIIAYWMGGAYLMATKRFAEYRLIGDPERAGLYRRSFKFYTEHSLLISMFFYALTSAFFLGIFLIKNRVELLISFPFFALLFSWYLRIGLLKDSPVQGSEKLYTRKWFMLYVVLFCLMLTALMFVDIPGLHSLLEDHFQLNH